MSRPWIVYKRIGGVLFPVARYKTGHNAKLRVRGTHPYECLHYAYIPLLSADMCSELGIKAVLQTGVE